MTEANTAENEDGLLKFALGKVYLKDVSLEAPNSPEAFLEGNNWNPKVILQHKIETRCIADDTYDVLLIVTITATEDEKTIFLVEVQQGGIFLIQGYDGTERLDKILNVRSPRVLYPYAREAVDNLIVKAGFPPLMLGPLNFKQAYDQKQANSSDT